VKDLLLLFFINKLKRNMNFGFSNMKVDYI